MEEMLSSQGMWPAGGSQQMMIVPMPNLSVLPMIIVNVNQIFYYGAVLHRVSL